MTQAEKFLQFLRERTEREICEMKVFVRIHNGELVITRHWVAAESRPIDVSGVSGQERTS